MARETTAELDEKVRAFFNTAVSYLHTTKPHFRAQYGTKEWVLRVTYPAGTWLEMRRDWARERIRLATDEAFAEAITKERFTPHGVWRRLKSAGISYDFIKMYAGSEIQRRRPTLPTKQEKYRAVIDELMTRGVPAAEITWHRVRQEAGVYLEPGPWFGRMTRSARGEHLNRAQVELTLAQGDNTALPPAILISPSAHELDLRSRGGKETIRRDHLRPDIAEVAWPLLCEAVQCGQLAGSTIYGHYHGYVLAGQLLGELIPDVTKASLRVIQQSWLAFEDGGQRSRQRLIRAALVSLFSRLFALAEEQTGIDRREMLLITGWVNLLSLRKPIEPRGDHLSAGEVDAVISACLTDIKSGVDFPAEGRELLSLSTISTAPENATPLIHWGVALMLLIMLLTGLRRESVVNIKLGDWAELHPGIYVLIWRHSKKREERIAVLPTSLALLLNHYVERMRELRQVLNTDRVFLFGNSAGLWQAELIKECLLDKLRKFVRRHCLARAGQPLKLNCMMLRRTFVTRELYDGRSLWVLRLQLGHRHLSTTKRYGQFDVYEHPAQVGSVLDAHGRRALTLWHGPVVIDNLDPEERARLLELRTQRDEGVGLCRHANCKKISEGPLLPCSLCEHLVTGREFFSAWEAEQNSRERKLAQLEAMPGWEMMLARRRQEYAMFVENYTRLKGEVN